LLYSLFYDDVDVDDDDDVDDNVDDDVQDASCIVKITRPKLKRFIAHINRCSSTTNDFNTPFFFCMPVLQTNSNIVTSMMIKELEKYKKGGETQNYYDIGRGNIPFLRFVMYPVEEKAGAFCSLSKKNHGYDKSGGTHVVSWMDQLKQLLAYSVETTVYNHTY
jgi:hypothetical protein